MVKKLKASKSKYSKSVIDESEDFSKDNFTSDFQEEDSMEDGSGNTPQEMDSDFKEVPENAQDYLDEEPLLIPHKRSRGLFQNNWWKKGLLKGFFVWLVFVILFYFFDFLGMVEVIDFRRWFFFLLFLLVLGMTYEKFNFNKLI